MTSTPRPTLLSEAIVQRAYLQALLVLNDDQRALDAVCRALHCLGIQYAHAIKQQAQPLFQRVLLRQLRLAHWRWQWQTAWPSLLARLIPPREADLTPGVLESWPQVTADAVTGWFANAQTGALILEILRILPTAQRQACWLLFIEGLPLPQVARTLASTRYSVRRNGDRALDTLATILAMKGVPPSSLPRPALAAGIAQAIAAWQQTLPLAPRKTLRQACDALARAQAAQAAASAGCGARWRQYHALHPLGSRLCGVAVLLCLGIGGWQWATPAADPPPAQTAMQLLAGEAPLALLLDPRFEASRHD